MDVTAPGMAPEKQLGVPEIGRIRPDMLRDALVRGWRDFRHFPFFGLVTAAVYVAAGWGIWAITRWTGQSYWMVLAVFGFPLIGPFSAVGLYEVSHRIDQGLPLNKREIFGVILSQSKRQLPSICAIIIVVLLFWFFLGHMIFALFLGLSTMTNVSSSFDLYLSAEGLTMLAVGTAVGAAFALLLYMITVIALPLLLDREVDFITAMITSFQTVQENFAVMMLWAAVIALSTLLALIPGFLGLFVVLPLFGHATWHLYKAAVDAAARD